MIQTTGKCRACPALVFWAKAEPTDKTPTPRNNPLDFEPSERGNLRLNRETGRYTVLTGDKLKAAQASGEKLYLSHFVSCPNRGQFKR